MENDTPTLVFRHSGWQRQRNYVHESLTRINKKEDHWTRCEASPGQVKTNQLIAPENRIHNFAMCGKFAHVFENPDKPGDYRVAGSCCNDRFCLPCGQSRSRAIALAVLEHLNGRQCRMVTLTVKSGGLTLERGINKLYEAFKALRRNEVWKNSVTGGVAFLEIKWSADKNHWHPHLHCLVEGKYINKQDLSNAWHRITGDSYIVHLTLVKHESSAQRYITKYASKPLNTSFSGIPERLDEAISTLKGVRMSMTFASWRGLKLTPPPLEEAWIRVASLDEVLRAAANNEAWAIDICNALEDERVDAAMITVRAHDPPHEDACTYHHDQLAFFDNADNPYAHTAF